MKKQGGDITIETLKGQGYASIFIGIGAQEGRTQNIPGEDFEGVLPAISFLKDVYDGKIDRITGRVVVIGGGFTAVDAARTAKRLGAEEVYITYRRTRDEMPATQEETCSTNIEEVYAGGDVNRVDSVIAAISAGKRAACSIDQQLSKNEAIVKMI